MQKTWDFLRNFMQKVGNVMQKAPNVLAAQPCQLEKMTDTETKRAEELVAGILDGTMRQTALTFLLKQNVASILNNEDGCLTAHEICDKTTDKLKPEQMQRMLRYSASIGLVKEEGRNGVPQFGKSLVTDLLEKSSDYVNARNDYVNATWSKNAIMELGVAIKEDSKEHVPFVAANGKPVFHFLAENPAALGVFHRLMTQSSKSDHKELIPFLVKVCGNKDGTRVLDVGGGQGAVMEQLKRAAPHLSCSVLDLPHVVDKTVGNQTGNIKFVRGDMFDKDTFPQADFVFMRNLLHDWSDEDCQRILKNIHSILPDNGSVLLAQCRVADPGQSDEDDWRGFNVDLTMMTIEGKERTEAENREMLERAGFKVEEKMSWRVTLQGKKCLTVASKFC